jgi:hypothetical protein
MNELFECPQNFDYKKEVSKLLKNISKQRTRIETAECYYDEYEIVYDAQEKIEQLNTQLADIKTKFYNSLPQNYTEGLKLKKWLEITGDYK